MKTIKEPTKIPKQIHFGDIVIDIYITFDEEALPGKECWFKVYKADTDELIMENTVILPEEGFENSLNVED